MVLRDVIERMMGSMQKSATPLGGVLWQNSPKSLESINQKGSISSPAKGSIEKCHPNFLIPQIYFTPKLLSLKKDDEVEGKRVRGLPMKLSELT